MRPLTTTVRTRSRESGREREREGDKFPPLAKVKGKVKEERESERAVEERKGASNIFSVWTAGQEYRIG